MTHGILEHVRNDECIRPRARRRFLTRPWTCPFCATRWKAVQTASGWAWVRFR